MPSLSVQQCNNVSHVYTRWKKWVCSFFFFFLRRPAQYSSETHNVPPPSSSRKCLSLTWKAQNVPHTLSFLPIPWKQGKLVLEKENIASCDGSFFSELFQGQTLESESAKAFFFPLSEKIQTECLWIACNIFSWHKFAWKKMLKFYSHCLLQLV